MIRARCSVSAVLSKAPPREGIRMNRVIFENKLELITFTQLWKCSPSTAADLWR